MLCVAFSIHVFGSQHSNCREPSNRYVPYTKHVRFGGLVLLMFSLQAASKPARPIQMLGMVYDIAE